MAIRTSQAKPTTGESGSAEPASKGGGRKNLYGDLKPGPPRRSEYLLWRRVLAQAIKDAVLGEGDVKREAAAWFIEGGFRRVCKKAFVPSEAVGPIMRKFLAAPSKEHRAMVADLIRALMAEGPERESSRP